MEVKPMYSKVSIRDWINDPSRYGYEVGRQLYDEFGRNPRLKSKYARGPVGNNLEDLLYELGKQVGADEVQEAAVVQKPVDVVQVATKKVEVSIVHDPIVHERKEDDPASVQALQSEWRKLMREANHRKSQILQLTTQEERRDAAKFVMDTWDRIYQIWNDLDHYKANGTLPQVKKEEEPVKPSGDIKKLMRRYENLRTYISRYKKDPKKADKVKAWEQEREEIGKLLNN